MPQHSVDIQLNSPLAPNGTPDKNKPRHGMELRSSPGCAQALALSRHYLQSATPKTPSVSPKSRPGKNCVRSGSGKHATVRPSSQPTVRGASPLKRKKPRKTTDPVPSPPGDPEPGDVDSSFSSSSSPSSPSSSSSCISCHFTEFLLDRAPITTRSRGAKRGPPDSSSHDPPAFRPDELQSSTPANTAFKVASQQRGQRQKSQTTSKPRRSRDGSAHESCSTSSRASTPLDQLSQNESSDQLSSDLSIELGLPEVELNISFEEDKEEEDEEEDEELPCFLLQISKKPARIKEGAFVWCKFRTYPFWPAVVKSVNQKLKKASIIWIDMPIFDKKRKGLYVPLKNLKPFDCEEANQLVCAANANHQAVIDWALELINDYVFRIACSSFTGSFLEYWTHIMSYPVRRKYPQRESEGLAIPSRQELEEHSQSTVEMLSSMEESVTELPDEGSPCSKRLLPDRSIAAHNRANEKLVHFIVSQRMVDQHLLAVIRGQQPSRWLRSFLKATRRLQVKNYLEDDKQLDQVYNYLKELFENVTDTAPCLANVKFMDDVRFAMDVLLPEAIISAIAGVDNVSLKKAEEKYLNGRCISDREREEFEFTIGQQMKTNLVSSHCLR